MRDDLRPYTDEEQAIANARAARGMRWIVGGFAIVFAIVYLVGRL